MKFKEPTSYEEFGVQQTNTLEGFPEIKGYDFDEGVDFEKYLASLSATGFQATNLARAIEIVKSMRREKATIYLSVTSNMMSSGLRDTIRYLVKNRVVHVLVMSAGAVEEDIIKTLRPFVVGQFNAPGRNLFESGINRIGNIFVPNDRYLYFEEFMTPFLDECFKQQKEEGKIWNSKNIIEAAGERLGKLHNEKAKGSVLYWAAKNGIPVFCPGLTDGAFGDMIYFAKQRYPDFILDSSQDIMDIVRVGLDAEKTGIIALGGGIAKHYTLNSQIFREGCDFAVYINTAQEFDGSDSGARTDEAVSWGKIKPSAPQVKVHADATIVFPLLVAGAWQNINQNKL